MMAVKKSYPYVMQDVRWPDNARARQTAEDPPDYRISQVRPRQLTPAEMHAITRPGATDPRYRAADRWLERWAVTHGSGRMLPLIATLKLRAASPTVTALDDRESIVIDNIVRQSPAWAATFAIFWYRSDYSVTQIADMLKIKRRRAVYEERDVVLSYYLGRLAQAGLEVNFWLPGS